MEKLLRSTRLEVDLAAVKYNMEQITGHCGPAKLLAVIKANAYSNGSLVLAKILMEAGAYALAVASLNEAMELRLAGLDYPLMILGFVDRSQLGLVVDYNITATIYDFNQAKILSQLAQARGKLQKAHIKIDTGMNRLGFKTTRENLGLIEKICQLPGLNVEGIYSHFAQSEIEDKSFTHDQYQEFSSYVTSLEELGLKFRIKHISNWGAACDLPAYNLDMVRLGVPLFGVYSNFQIQSPKIKLRLSMSLKTKISNLKTVKKGESISYNRQFFCEKDMTIATIPLGYADGISQEMVDLLDFYIGDIKIKSVGRICMDQLMLDVTGLDGLELEDEVVVFDQRNQEFLSARNIANLSRRLPRVYMENGKVLGQLDYLMGQEIIY